jgi:hypothetical protein
MRVFRKDFGIMLPSTFQRFGLGLLTHCTISNLGRGDPDITEWLEYRMYQPVWYLDPRDFPEEKKVLGHGWVLHIESDKHSVAGLFPSWDK